MDLRLNNYKSIYFFIASLLTCSHANADMFNLTYTVSSDTVTATFQGTASGNDITNISNVSVWLNGIALNDNGALATDSWSSSQGWVSGGSVVSFNGADNNFAFINYVPNNPSTSSNPNDFLSVENQAGIGHQYITEVYYPAIIPSIVPSIGSYTNFLVILDPMTSTNYSVSAVPVPSSIVLFASGLIGFTASRKRVNYS